MSTEKKPTHRALNMQFCVTFREIAALYDIPPGTGLHGRAHLPAAIKKWQPAEATLVYRLEDFPELQPLARCTPEHAVTTAPDGTVSEGPAWCREDGYSRIRREANVDDQGNAPPRVDLSAEPAGVYQDVSEAGTAEGKVFQRTFVREDSRPIKKGWVYVYCDSGSGPELVYELCFRDGKFVYVDFRAKANAGRDEREPIDGGARRSSLVLEYVDHRSSERLRYWCLFAQYQLPWSALPHATGWIAPGSVIARAQRLDDWFWTDLYDLATPDKLLDRPSFIRKFPKGGKPGHCIHLVNPLREALRRHERYAHALDEWNAEVKRVTGNREYALAKRVEAFARPSFDRWRLVAPRLVPYLRDSEEKMDRLRVAVIVAARELMRWITGAYRVRTHEGFGGSSSTWLSDGDASDTGKRQSLHWTDDDAPGDGPRHNAYSALLRDYLEQHGEKAGVSDEVVKEVAETAARVLGHLDQVPEGAALLRRLARAPLRRMEKELGELAKEVDEADEKKKEEAERGEIMAELYDGGLALLIEGTRKGVLCAGTLALKAVLPAFIEHFKAPLEKFEHWLEHHYHVKAKLKSASPLGMIDAKMREELDHGWIDVWRAERGKAKYDALTHTKSYQRLEKLERLERFEKGTEYGEVLFGRLAAVLQSANFVYSCLRAWKEHDSWAYLEAGKSAAEAVAAWLDATKAGKAAELKLSWLGIEGAAVESLKVAPLVDSVACAAEMVIIIHEYDEAKNQEQRVGQGERLAGATICLIGALVGACGLAVPAAFIGALGLLLQTVGSYTAAENSPDLRYLRNSRWGPSGRFDIATVDGAKLRAHLALAPDDVARELECLDELVFDFEPELAAVDEQTRMPMAAVCLSMGKKLRNRETNMFLPMSRWSATLKVQTLGLPEHEMIFPGPNPPDAYHHRLSAGEPVEVQRMHALNETAVEGEIEVDVYGDRSRIIKREVERRVVSLSRQ